ncbi:Helix-turn-helix domain protein [Verrucomicrobiia bacterium DG1235]|nr:Helix-turn-helix domain protein [Verrucomicrobiae bacterium DG1235]
MASELESADGAVPAFNFEILRDIRKRADLTLSALSERSGVSVAVISKLERNQTQAEVGTLHKIGKVFGMRATDLLSLAEAPISNKKSSVKYKSGDFALEAIRYGNADCIYATAEAGARVSKPEIHHDDHEICWVLSGKVRLDLPNESHELGAGQSIQFDAIQEHRYEAIEQCEVVIVHIRKEKRY